MFIQPCCFVLFRPEILDKLIELQNFENQFLPNALRTFFNETSPPNERNDYLSTLVDRFSQRFCECNPQLGFSKGLCRFLVHTTLLLHNIYRMIRKVNQYVQLGNCFIGNSYNLMFFLFVLQTPFMLCVSLSLCCLLTSPVLPSKTKCPRESSLETPARQHRESQMILQDISTIMSTWLAMWHRRHERGWEVKKKRTVMIQQQSALEISIVIIKGEIIKYLLCDCKHYCAIMTAAKDQTRNSSRNHKKYNVV